jgi:hypothetical protein
MEQGIGVIQGTGVRIGGGGFSFGFSDGFEIT